MTRLEDLKKGMRIRGLVPYQIVTLIAVEGSGSKGSAFYTVTVFYKRNDDNIEERPLYREDEADLEIVQDERLWAFDADGKLLRLVSEAYRIRLAHLFDPVLAVHTSLIEPLPHQITAVYDEMLPRQPLRFLLADDPGAGKTIMAGLLIRELIARGDVRRCLICAPSKLSEQWRDELSSKFQLKFRIFTRDMMKKASQDENPFEEDDQLIVSLDQVKQNEYMDRLRPTNWDLVVCDEAHQMSANFFGKKITKTARYRLGELLGKITRHFLLMTATPHNGKEGDFQLFMELLDEERFKGRLWDDIRRVDASDLMRRMIKEDLRNFDGTPLFPERKAYTTNYELSLEEDVLYEKVTEYVRDEFKHAEQLKDGRRRNRVGFAMISLQRRLASSPEAIYQSLKSRRERLVDRLCGVLLIKILNLRWNFVQSSSRHHQDFLETIDRNYDDDNYWEELENSPATQREKKEDEFAVRATAAGNIEELEDEIDVLDDLEAEALQVRLSGNDRKWEELRGLFDVPEMQNDDGTQRKLVIFTEYRATLNYLIENLQTLFSHPDAIVTIHGNIPLDKRRETEDRFRNDPKTLILVATDAAGEGINLQCANLMVNYDLPWNPNRLEQRFGRIHRIGQNEVCHLWNLVAKNTREGQVYHSLLEKLRTESDALDGQVFDVLGKLFQETPLRKLLIEAVRGDDPQSQVQTIDKVVDQAKYRNILENQALAIDSIDTSRIMQIREKTEQARAGRLQSWHIKEFILQAFEHFPGEIIEREGGRYEVTRVPGVIRKHAREQGMGFVRDEYDRICFERDLIHPPNQPKAEFIRPGHPLLDATVSYLLKRERDTTLKHGAMLVDESDNDTRLRVLFYLEWSIQVAGSLDGEPYTISRKVHFIEIDSTDNVRDAGVAPYLDYRPATSEDREQIRTLLEQGWPRGRELDIEKQAVQYANKCLVRPHLREVRPRHIERIDKIEAAVKERLTKEINYQEKLIAKFESQEHLARLNKEQAQERKRQLEERLEKRLEKLEWERQINAKPPIVVGAALIIPAGLLRGEQNDS